MDDMAPKANRQYGDSRMQRRCNNGVQLLQPGCELFM